MSPRLVLTLLVLFLSAVCTSSSGAMGEPPTSSGAPEGWGGTTGFAPVAVAPAGFDDTLSPISALRGPFPAGPDTRDMAAPDPADGSAVPLWGRLQQIGPELRGSARIELEPGADTAPAVLAQARHIADRWNGGDYEQAIGSLRVLEESGARLALGIDWSSATGPGGLRDGGTDIRLGTRTGARGVAVDFSRQNGHIFAVVQWGSLSAESYWTVHISTDHGATWSQTYEYYSNGGIGDVDAATVGSYLYVGYIMGGAENELRMRRCTVSNGAVDATYGYHTALTAATGTFTEVAVATNSDSFENRIYGLVISSLNTLRFVWDVATDGTTFTEDSPTTSNPSGGLDAAWVPHYGGSDPVLYASYAGTDDDIHVQGYDASTWTDVPVAMGAGADKETSISAFDNNVICAYETDTPTGRGVYYQISYDAGGIWNIGTLATPDGSPVTAYGNPSVDARTGRGTTIIYSAEMGEPDDIYYQCRGGYAPGPWEDRTAFDDTDVLTGTETALNPLSYEPGFFDHGAVYIGSDGIAYFDRPYSPASDVPETAAGSPRLLPAFPNPFRDEGEIRFVLAEPGQVSLQLFDVLGRRVAVLLDGPLGAGSHVVPLRGQDLGSGAYYYRLSSGMQQSEGRLTRIR